MPRLTPGGEGPELDRAIADKQVGAAISYATVMEQAEKDPEKLRDIHRAMRREPELLKNGVGLEAAGDDIVFESIDKLIEEDRKKLSKDVSRIEEDITKKKDYLSLKEFLGEAAITGENAKVLGFVTELNRALKDDHLAVQFTSPEGNSYVLVDTDSKKIETHGRMQPNATHLSDYLPKWTR